MDPFAQYEQVLAAWLSRGTTLGEAYVTDRAEDGASFALRR